MSLHTNAQTLTKTDNYLITFLVEETIGFNIVYSLSILQSGNTFNIKKFHSENRPILANREFRKCLYMIQHNQSLKKKSQKP